MKKFLKYLLYFALPLLALACFFEIYLRQITTTYTEKEKGILENHDKIEVLILGNSRPTLGIDPNEFDLYTYNLANVAQPIYYDKRIALKYLDKLTSLKYVFITLDVSSFDYSRMQLREIWSYYGNGIEYEDQMPFLSKISYLKGYSPPIAAQLLKNDLSGKYKTIKAIDLDPEYRLDTPITKGFFTYKGTNEAGLSAAQIAIRTNKSRDRGVAPEFYAIQKDLDEFIVILKARKITPILLTMPCYEPYVKALHKVVLNRSETAYTNLAKKHGLEYWNYLNLPMERADFHDFDHFNIKGALKFSKVLNVRLNTLDAR